MSSIQPQGDLVPPKEPFCTSLHGDQFQIRNREGAYVFELNDMARLQRFLVIGYDGGTYYASDDDTQNENVEFIRRLINSGKGLEVVTKIKEISVSRRNIKQNALLRALAVCAKSSHRHTKRAAYGILQDVCRNPTHLFMFVEFCEKESNNGSGWGSAHKRAISEWYISKTPEELARLVTKYKKHKRWTHRDVVRLAHTKPSDQFVGFILRYLVKDLNKAREMYIQNANGINPESAAKLDKLAELMSVFEEALTCSSEQRLCLLIRQHKLSWEHCNSALLKSREIWIAMLPHMPIEATLRNLGRMSSYGVFVENSEEEDIVVQKIRSINTLLGLPVGGHDALAVHGDLSEYRYVIEELNGRRRNIIHPFKILLAMVTYKTGHGDKGDLTWTPNRRIVEALDTAFYQAFKEVEPTGKKFYLGVDVSSSMSQPVLGSNNIQCATAAAAMMMLTVKTEDDCIIKGFGDRMVDVNIEPTDTIDAVQRKMEAVPAGDTDCSQPMIDAMENKIKDIDVFVIYTDNETRSGIGHPFYALEKYRTYANNPNVKLIVCGMCSSKFTIANQDDPHMLDVVGFDSAAPAIISEFVLGQI